MQGKIPRHCPICGLKFYDYPSGRKYCGDCDPGKYAYKRRNKRKKVFKKYRCKDCLNSFFAYAFENSKRKDKCPFCLSTNLKDIKDYRRF